MAYQQEPDLSRETFLLGEVGGESACILVQCSGFEAGGGVVGVRTQLDLAPYWPTD